MLFHSLNILFSSLNILSSLNDSSSLILFHFFFLLQQNIVLCCIFNDMLINYSAQHQFLSCHSLSVITDTLYILCSHSSMWVIQLYNSLMSANFSSSEKLIEALTVLLKSTAHALCILNTHQSHCCQKYIELCEQQCIEKMKSETSLNSEEEYETAVD